MSVSMSSVVLGSAEPLHGVEVAAKTLANRRKKERDRAKKAAQLAICPGGGMWDGNGEAVAGNMAVAFAVSSAEPAGAEIAPKGTKVMVPKKESKAAQAAKKRLAEAAALRAERDAFEEAERQRIAKEKAEMEAEIAKHKRMLDERRRRSQEKIARAKAAGTYETKKQRQYKAQAARLRAEFGFVMESAESVGDDSTDLKFERALRAAPAQKMVRKQCEQRGDEHQVPASSGVVAKQCAVQVWETKHDGQAVDNWEEMNEIETESDHCGASRDEVDELEEVDGDPEEDFLGYRSPIVCIMGHVDTGKTKLLDKIRRTKVQEQEPGGITQQIGATFFPDIALHEQTSKVDPDFEIETPGLMIIDTPGHESFNNLRTRGSSLCDIAILVIDIMHGLEPQTVESLELLKKRRCPFIIAMNKVDRLHGWREKHYAGIQDAFNRQDDSIRDEFQKRFDDIQTQLAERGLNCYLYWENEDISKYVSIVPTSALTGEGVPDLLYTILNFCYTIIPHRLEITANLQCTVIEVKNIEGLGMTVDVVLVNGTLREGDQIVVAGIDGPIVTTIRALLTPQPMREMRVRNEYVHHAQISTSMGVKICAPGLENAVAGSEIHVVGPHDDIEQLKEEIHESVKSILLDFEKQAEGVYVKASTLGSLEALLAFLSEMNIPVFDIGIGDVHKKDVKRAMIMKEKKHKEYALILAFDVKVSNEAKVLADNDDVPIFTADIIYHLFDRFTEYMAMFKEIEKGKARNEAVFPVILQIDKQHIFHKTDPIVFGCDVLDGQLRPGTPICVPDKDFLEIGRVASIEINRRPVQIGKKGQKVCVKLEQNTSQHHIAYGRQFEYSNMLYSKISRASIDVLKENFVDELSKDDWQVLRGMKSLFKIR